MDMKAIKVVGVITLVSSSAAWRCSNIGLVFMCAATHDNATVKHSTACNGYSLIHHTDLWYNNCHKMVWC